MEQKLWKDIDTTSISLSESSKERTNFVSVGEEAEATSVDRLGGFWIGYCESYDLMMMITTVLLRGEVK